MIPDLLQNQETRFVGMGQLTLRRESAILTVGWWLMDEQTTVRVLNLNDYERWMEVWQRAGLHSMRPRGRDSRAAFARQLASGTHTMIGLEVATELVGVVLATQDGRKGWINRLAVLPEHRHHGYAARLVAAAEKALREQGMTVIAALIEPQNDTSLALFRKLGYLEATGLHYVSKRESEEA
jgi:ribosomal protein S18 acetylase RimI-like enzyme